MGTPRTFEIDDPLGEVDGDLRHTEMTATAYTITAALAIPFAALRTNLQKHKADEGTLTDNILLARALAFSADDDLNRLVDDTKNAVLALSNGDYQAPLYKQLFERQSPSELKSTLIGSQLATMRTWVGPLGTAGNAELSTIAMRLTAAHKR